MKDASLKKLHAARFHAYDLLKDRTILMENRSVVVRGWGRG